MDGGNKGDRQPSHLFNPIGFLGQNMKRRRSHIPRPCLMQDYGCDDLLNTLGMRAHEGRVRVASYCIRHLSHLRVHVKHNLS